MSVWNSEKTEEACVRCLGRHDVDEPFDRVPDAPRVHWGGEKRDSIKSRGGRRHVGLEEAERPVTRGTAFDECHDQENSNRAFDIYIALSDVRWIYHSCF